MLKYLCLLCFIAPSLLFCQSKVSPLDKKTQKKFDKALACIKKKEDPKHLQTVEQTIEAYPEYLDGRVKLTTYYLSKGQKDKAYPHLQILAQSDSKLSPRVGGELLDIYDERQEFDKAITVAEKILADNKLREDSRALLNRRITEMNFRKKAYANPVEFLPTKLDTQINTEASEYLPAFNADGSMVIYTSRTVGERTQEDLFYAKKLTDSTFSKGEPILELQTPENEGAHTFSANGRILIFTACDRRDSQGGCDLYISFYKNETWTEPRNLGPTINTRYWESQPCLSSDNKTLYYSSRRKGGHGEIDIWKSTIKAQGGWGEPVNLGPAINTKENDQSPFLHPDNKTFYFESEGHIGMGKGDLFVSRLSDSLTWGTPLNLGYPINNGAQQGALFVDLSGNHAYYASEDTSAINTSYDIYRFELPEELKPQPTSYFSIKVIDATTKKPLSTRIELKLLSSASSNVFTTDGKGKAISTITPGNYALNINKKGYIFHSENILINEGKSINEPTAFVVELQKLKTPESPVAEKNPEPIVLKNVFFESGSATLLPESDFEISKLFNLLSTQEDIRIMITGHTDDVGQDAANQKLSENRAKAVYQSLIDKGIDKSRMDYRGLGESKPLADNNTEAGKQINRRTEFQIIE